MIVAHKHGSFEMTRDSVLEGSYVSRISDDVVPRVPEVPDSVGRVCLHLLGVAFGGNDGLFAVLHE